MRLPEQRLWQRLRERAVAARIYVDRVENVVVSGFPDVHGMPPVPGGRAWLLEMKSAPPRARSTTPAFGAAYGLEPEQVAWHLRYARRHGRSYVLGAVYGTKRVWLLRGADAELFNDLTPEELSDVAEADTWNGIIEVLKK